MFREVVISKPTKFFECSECKTRYTEKQFHGPMVGGGLTCPNCYQLRQMKRELCPTTSKPRCES